MELTILRGHDQQKPLLGARLDAAHPLAVGLTDLWLFNEGSGPVYSVARPNTAAALSSPAPTWVTSQNGPALSFPSTSSVYLDTGITINGNYNTASGTVVVRVYPQIAVTGTLTSNLLGSTGTGEFILQRTNLPGFNFGWSPNKVTVAASASTWVQNVWQMYAVTWTSAATSLYRDGVLLGSGSGITAPSVAGTLYLGNENGNTGSFAAASFIDYAAVWNRALSSTELLSVATEPYALVCQQSARRFVPLVQGDPFPLAHNSVALLQRNASYRM